MPHICRIFRQNAAYFTAFLAGELPAYFPKKSRYKRVSLIICIIELWWQLANSDFSVARTLGFDLSSV